MRLILSQSGIPAEDEIVLDFLRFAVQRGIDLARLWVAVQNDKVLWAILPLVSAGRTALLLSPTTSPSQARESIARTLIDKVVETCAQAGVQLTQVLIDPGDTISNRIYVASGFSYLAELVYLHRLTRGVPDAPPAIPEGTRWVTYNAETHALFAKAIEESYVDSLDCPSLNGKRNLDDVIEGHKAAGEHDPALWSALVEGDRAQGVVLLSRTPRNDSMELVYLGVVPNSRGKGVSDLLMKRALWLAHQQELSRLSLAVDSKNAPALRLYYRHGLTRITTRVALMRELAHA